MIEKGRQGAAGPLQEAPERGHEGHEERRGEPLEAPRRPDPEQRAHQDREVPSSEGNKVALLVILDSAQPHPPRTARVADVSETPLRALRSQPLKTPTLLSAHSPAIGPERFSPSRGLVLPPARTSLSPLGDVRPKIVGRAFRNRLRLVVALVGDDLGGKRVASCTSDVFLCLADTLEQGLAVGLIGWIDRRRDDDLALEIDHVLGLVGEMGAAVLHLGDAALWIGRGFPVLVGNALLPLAIEPAGVLLARILDARLLREA